jgi:hypothetical protein
LPVAAEGREYMNGVVMLLTGIVGDIDITGLEVTGIE